MNLDTSTSSPRPDTGLPRRTFIKTAAWAAPVIATAIAVPLAAASVGAGARSFTPSITAGLAVPDQFTGPLTYSAGIEYTTFVSDDPAAATFTWAIHLVNRYDDSAAPILVDSGTAVIARGDTWTTGGTFDTSATPPGTYRATITVSTPALTKDTWSEIRLALPLAQPPVPAREDLTLQLDADYVAPAPENLNRALLPWGVAIGYTGSDTAHSYLFGWGLTIRRAGVAEPVFDTGPTAISGRASVDAPQHHEDVFSNDNLGVEPGTYTVTLTVNTTPALTTEKTVVVPA